MPLPEDCYWCGEWNEAERGMIASRCWRCHAPILADADHLVARVAALQAEAESVAAAEAVRKAMPDLLRDPTALLPAREVATRVAQVFAPHVAQIERCAQRDGIDGLGADVHRRLVLGMPYADERLQHMSRLPDLPRPGMAPDVWLADLLTWWKNLEITQWRTPLIGFAEIAVLEATITSGSRDSIADAAAQVQRLLGEPEWWFRVPAVRLLARWEIWWNAPRGSWDGSAQLVRAILSQSGERKPSHIGRLAGIVCTDGIEPVARISAAIRSYWGWSADHPGAPELARMVHAHLVQALTCDDEAAVLGAALALAREDILLPRCAERADLIAPTVCVLSRTGVGLASVRAWLLDPVCTTLVIDNLRGSWIGLAADLVVVMPRLESGPARRLMEILRSEVPFASQWQAAQAISNRSLSEEWTMQLAQRADDAQVEALLDAVQPNPSTLALGALIASVRGRPALVRLTKKLADQGDAPLAEADGVALKLIACDADLTELLKPRDAARPLILAILRQCVIRLMADRLKRTQAIALVMELERHPVREVQTLGRDLHRTYAAIVPPNVHSLAEEGRRLILSDTGSRYRAAVAEFGAAGLPNLETLAHEHGLTPFSLLRRIEDWLRLESKPAITGMLSRLTASMEADELARCLGCGSGFIHALRLADLATQTVGSHFGLLCVRALGRLITSDQFARRQVQQWLARHPDREIAMALAEAIGARIDTDPIRHSEGNGADL